MSVNFSIDDTSVRKQILTAIYNMRQKPEVSINGRYNELPTKELYQLLGDIVEAYEEFCEFRTTVQQGLATVSSLLEEPKNRLTRSQRRLANLERKREGKRAALQPTEPGREVIDFKTQHDRNLTLIHQNKDQPTPIRDAPFQDLRAFIKEPLMQINEENFGFLSLSQNFKNIKKDGRIKYTEPQTIISTLGGKVSYRKKAPEESSPPPPQQTDSSSFEEHLSTFRRTPINFHPVSSGSRFEPPIARSGNIYTGEASTPFLDLSSFLPDEDMVSQVHDGLNPLDVAKFINPSAEVPSSLLSMELSLLDEHILQEAHASSTTAQQNEIKYSEATSRAGDEHLFDTESEFEDTVEEPAADPIIASQNRFAALLAESNRIY